MSSDKQFGPATIDLPAGKRCGKRKTRTELIYVVDDEPIMTQLISSHLRSGGYSCVQTFNDAIKTIDALHTKPPELLITDLLMPEMSGRVLMHLVESDPELASIPMLVASVQSRDDQIEEIMELGAVGFVGKPVDREALLDQVDHLLEQQQRMNELSKSAYSELERIRHVRAQSRRMIEAQLRNELRWDKG